MTWETVQIALVLALLVAVFVGFVRERLPPDTVAMLAFSILLATGILTAKEAMGVFSNPGPITVAGMFILSAALERTGVIERAGILVSKASGRSPVLAILGLMLGVMLLSAFINNTPVVVVLTPVAIVLARSLRISPAQVLIPVSFASIFGGTTTLIGTSTNLLVNGLIIANGLPAISMFEFTVPGLIMGLAGVAYMVLIGRRLLPTHSAGFMLDRPRRSFLAEVLIPHGSPLIGKTLLQAGFTPSRGADVIDVIHRDSSLRFSLDQVALAEGDRVVLRTKAADVMGWREAGSSVLGKPEEHLVEPVGGEATVVMEGVVGPRSRLIGYRIRDLNFRRLYGVYILAIHRQGEELRSNFAEIELAFGDVLLLEGPRDGLQRLFERRVLVNLTEPSERPYRRNKAPFVITAILAVMILAAFEVLPIEALALIAATAVVGLGCLTPEEAYDAIEWRILLLIFGMLALGLAMEKTGAAAMIVRSLVGVVEGLGPLAVLSLVYFFASLLTEVISNNATAILLTPIALGLAHQLGTSPRPFVMAVMFAASASFSTPIGYQTNTFVYGAGGYRFADFLRVGIPLNLLMWIIATLIIPWFWPF